MVCRILALSDQGLNSGPQQWKRTVLTTGPPENSHLFLFLKMASLIQHCPRALSAMIETTWVTTVPNSSYLWYVASEYIKCSWSNWTEFYLLLINLYLNSHMWLMATILDIDTISRPHQSVQHFMRAQQCWINELKLNSITINQVNNEDKPDKPSSPGVLFLPHADHSALKTEAYSFLDPQCIK